MQNVLAIFVHPKSGNVRKNYYSLFLILSVFIFSRCISTVKITSVAEKNKDGDLLLKWEVSPDQDGNINIYSSQSDDSPGNFVPVKTSKITEQFAVINPSSPDIREYYLLKTTSALSGIITNRTIEMRNIKNFRDVGGYFTKNDKQMRWGMIYRSGDLSNATLYDQERIRRLNIKTIIDLRSEKSMTKFPILVHPSINKIAIPITQLDTDALNEMMEDKKLTQSDAVRKIQDSYIGIIENSKEKFEELFLVLSDFNNYPILISGSLGKDRVGLATYLILSAMGIPQNVILNDYMLSQNAINVLQIVDDVHSKPEYFQEAVTALLTVKPSYLNYTIDYINQKYGSVDSYIEKELNFPNNKKSSLHNFLIYNH